MSRSAREFGLRYLLSRQGDHVHFSPEETRERILKAAAGLMKRKGFKAVTTKLIAKEAGVNETTLFRHFGSKKGIVDALVGHFSYVPMFQKVVSNVVWNLETDLLSLSGAYQQFKKHNGDMVIIGLKEAGAFPEIDEKAASIPKEFKDILLQYFETMREKGLLRDINIEAQALAFIWVNLGFFISRSVYGDRITEINNDVFLSQCISTFARGLTPSNDFN